MRRIILPLVLVTVLAGIFVPSAAALRFTDESYFTPVGIVGQPYSHTFHGAGGCGPDPNVPNSGLPYQYRILDGSLPAGLTLSKAGTISGTPAAAGESSFWVELSDENPPSASWCRPETAERLFTIKILPALSVEQQSLAPIVKDHPYSFKVTAAGGGAQIWSVFSGVLAPGIALSTDGTLSGTPTQVGDFQFVVKVTDGVRTDTETLVLRVREELKAVVPTTVPAAEVGIALKPITFTAAGGTGPYKWTVDPATPLPAGFTLTEQGVLNGTPTAPGPLQLTVVVSDTNGFVANGQITLDVKAKLAFLTKKLPQGKIGKEYNKKILTKDGVLPLTRMKVVAGSGKFPVGIRFDRTLGAIVGTPRIAGTFTFAIEAVDSLGVTVKQTFTLKVLPKPKKKK